MPVPDPGLHDQRSWRELFRIGGWIVLALGIVLTAIALVDFFSAFGAFRAPQNFWMALIGLPLIGVGSWMLRAGYIGPASRYLAGEVTPTIRDAMGHLGIGSGQLVCASCGGRSAADATFCDDCGAALRRTCPACNGSNAPDAKFCDDCGTALAEA